MWNLTGPKCKENAVSVIPVADHAPLPWCCFSVYSLMPLHLFDSVIGFNV